MYVTHRNFANFPKFYGHLVINSNSNNNSNNNNNNNNNNYYYYYITGNATLPVRKAESLVHFLDRFFELKRNRIEKRIDNRFHTTGESQSEPLLQYSYLL